MNRKTKILYDRKFETSKMRIFENLDIQRSGLLIEGFKHLKLADRKIKKLQN